MRHTLIVLPLFLVLLFRTAYCAEPAASTIDSSSLDFWIGEWSLSWDEADGKTGRGSNRVERVLGGKVIQENFAAAEGENAGFVGKSWSVYNARTGAWKQTWVDNQGAYLDFDFRWDENGRIFFREFTGPKGDVIQQRMIFRDIQANSFTWDWQVSTDKGRNWTQRWLIRYQRK